MFVHISIFSRYLGGTGEFHSPLYMLLLCHHDRMRIIMLKRHLNFELFWVNIIVFV